LSVRAITSLAAIMKSSINFTRAVLLPGNNPLHLAIGDNGLRLDAIEVERAHTVACLPERLCGFVLELELRRKTG